MCSRSGSSKTFLRRVRGRLTTRAVCHVVHGRSGRSRSNNCSAASAHAFIGSWSAHLMSTTASPRANRKCAAGDGGGGGGLRPARGGGGGGPPASSARSPGPGGGGGGPASGPPGGGGGGA